MIAGSQAPGSDVIGYGLVAEGGDGRGDDGGENGFQDGRSGGKKTPAMIWGAIDMKYGEDGRGGVCGEFSVGIGCPNNGQTGML